MYICYSGAFEVIRTRLLASASCAGSENKQTQGNPPQDDFINIGQLIELLHACSEHLKPQFIQEYYLNINLKKLIEDRVRLITDVELKKLDKLTFNNILSHTRGLALNAGNIYI